MTDNLNITGGFRQIAFPAYIPNILHSLNKEAIYNFCNIAQVSGMMRETEK